MFPTPIVIEPKQSANSCLIWLHGLGANANDLVPLSRALNFNSIDSARFIFPDAPVQPVTLNAGMKMPAWFDVYELSNLSKFDEKGVITSQQYINQLIAQQIQSGISTERVILAGFSQGGALAIYTGSHHTPKIGGILGLSTFFPDANYLAEQDLPPIFLAHGTRDSVISLKRAELTRSMLEQKTNTLTWKTYPMQHEICPQEIIDINTWLKDILD